MEPFETKTNGARKSSFNNKTTIVFAVICLVFIGLVIIGSIFIARQKSTTPTVLAPEVIQQKYKQASDSYDQALVGGVSADQRNQYLDQSISNLDIVLKNQPTNNDALIKIISALEIKGDYNGAINYLKEYVPANPNNTYLLNLYASIYAQQKLYSLAEQFYTKSLTIDPKNVYTYLDFSQLYITENKEDFAISLLQTGLQRLPGNVGLTEKLNSLK